MNMDSNLYSTRLFVRKTQKNVLISGLIFGSLLIFFWTRAIGYGFLSGVTVGVVNIQLMSVDVFTMIGKDPRKAQKFIIGRYVLRFAILFGFLALIATRTDFNIIAAFVGVFFSKVVLVGTQIIQGLNVTRKI